MLCLTFITIKVIRYGCTDGPTRNIEKLFKIYILFGLHSLMQQYKYDHSMQGFNEKKNIRKQTF